MKRATPEDLQLIGEVAQSMFYGAWAYQQMESAAGKEINNACLISGVLSAAAMMLQMVPAQWREDALAQFLIACREEPEADHKVN